MIEIVEHKKFTCDWCGRVREVRSYKMQVRQFDGYDRYEYCEDNIELCPVCQDEALKLLKAHKKAHTEKAEAENDRLTKMVDWLANKLIYCPSEFTNCAVDCAECRKEAARLTVAAEEE